MGISKKQAVTQKVELDKLRLGMTADGHVLVGIKGSDGALEPDKSRDVSEDFYNILKTIGAIEATMLNGREKKQLILPSVQAIQEIQNDDSKEG